jgi:hypothetical protein
MVITVNKNIFIQRFQDYGRGENFSYDGLTALFEHLDECGTVDQELDVIAICCEFSECSEEGLISDYGYLVEYEEFEDDNENEEKIKAIVSALEDKTTVLTLRNGLYIVGSF